MLIVDRLIIGGIRFVLDKVASAVEAELNDDAVHRERLLEAQMKLELGEITDEEFAQIEADVLATLRDINERKTGGAGPAIEMSKKEEGDTFQVDIEFGGDDSEDR